MSHDQSVPVKRLAWVFTMSKPAPAQPGLLGRVREVEEGGVYYSPSRIPFQVIALGKHAQDCTIPMVIFTNLIPTPDQPQGTIWTLEESVFLSIYQEAL